jgi:signal transduction histidine kinase
MNIKFNFENQNIELISDKNANILIKKVSMPSAELIQINKELIKTQTMLELYKDSIKRVLFMISHKTRQPIAHLLGLSNLLALSSNSSHTTNKLIDSIKKSANQIEIFTRELTDYINGIGSKEK